jgi:hypothetical protein
MPRTGSPSSPASQSSTRHSRRPSKSVTSAPDKDPSALPPVPTDGHRPTGHRRDKTSSATSIHRPRKDSLSSESKALPPPPLHDPAPRSLMKSRTKSAPLIPNGLILLDQPPGRSNGLRFRDVGPTDSGDDEISRDPFFQRYATAPLGEASDVGLIMKSPRLDRSESFPSPSLNHARQESNQEIPWSTSQSGAPWSPTSASLQPFHEINIVVLGAAGIGKSTFVLKAFDLRELPPAAFTRRKMSLDGKLYAIRLIELGFEHLQFDEQGSIVWPDVVDREPVPPIDGAFALYDVTSPSSLAHLPETLSMAPSIATWLTIQGESTPPEFHFCSLPVNATTRRRCDRSILRESTPRSGPWSGTFAPSRRPSHHLTHKRDASRCCCARF